MGDHRDNDNNLDLHATRLLRKCIYDQHLVLLCPIRHTVRTDSILNVRNYVRLLPDFLVKRNLDRIQRLEHHSDIYLRSASHTEIYIWELQANEFFD